MSENTLTTVASYSFPHEAHIAVARLEAEGIPAHIFDQHTINMNWLYSDALGGVRVKVAKRHVDQATDILAEDYSEFVNAQFDIDEEKCPSCQKGPLIPYTKGKKPAFLLWLITLGFALYPLKKGLQCEACGEFINVKRTSTPSEIDDSST